MVFVPIPNTLKVALEAVEQGQVVVNTFYVNRDTAWTAEDALIVAADVYSWWLTSIAPLQHSGLTVTRVTATDQTTQHSFGVEYIPGSVVYGSVATAPMPNNVALAVKWITALRGRSYRGRTYHTGIAREQVTGNSINDGVKASLLTAYKALLTHFTDPDAKLVVASRQLDKQIRNVGVCTPITSASIDFTLDSQRRRLPGRGR
jgi:hypothetical protein